MGTIEFNRWPKELSDYYRRQHYWIDRSLCEIISNQAANNGQSCAVICKNRVFTYADIDELSDNLAKNLANSGYGHGDTALVQLPNIAEFYIVFFALLKIGVVPVNALFNHKQHELLAYARQIKPRLLIGTRSHPSFSTLAESLSLEGLSPLVLLLDNVTAEFDLALWLERPVNSTCSFSPTNADEVAFFQLSGGSTGTPKLIPRTHNDYYYSVRESAEICGVTESSRFLCALPAPHNYILSSPGALGVFYKGGCVVMAPNPEPLSCFQLINQHQVTIVPLVPAAAAIWVKEAPLHINLLGSLTLIQVGGANFASSLAKEVLAVFNCQLQQVFGMAEGLVNYTRLDDAKDTICNTQGRPICRDDELKIVDASGECLAPGSAGMLATRGPYTFRGYYKSADHNRNVFDSEGFYYTGDIVELTPNGYLKVLGRVKDQINRGGEKIAAEEVENLLVTLDGITHAAIVPMDDELLGEKTCAFIVPSDDLIQPSAIRRHLMEIGIADYKLPDRIQFIKEMPLTAVGKIDKIALRNLLKAHG